MSRTIEPGDNRARVDVMVRSLPLIRGLRAAKLFAEPKDEGGSFTCVRLIPRDDRLIITAAHPLAMFSTSAPLVEAAWSDAGVVELGCDQVAEIVAVYGAQPDGDAQMRITATERKVRLVDSSGFIDGLDHIWERRFMEDTAPDVPAAMDGAWPDELVPVKLPPVSQGIAATVEKAAAVFAKSEILISCTDTHHLFAIGAAARVLSVVPEVYRPGAEDDEAPGAPAEGGGVVDVAVADTRVVTFSPPGEVSDDHRSRSCGCRGTAVRHRPARP